MDIGVLGTGAVGRTLAGALVDAGYRVKMGARSPASPKAIEWVLLAGPDASEGSFADAARFGELIFNCTAGSASLQALQQAGAQNLSGKTLVDVANPLDFSTGKPPTLTVCNTDSLGEQIQRTFPEVRVVKALNTLNSDIMVRPSMLAGDHQIYLCGNDAAAKTEVTELLVRAFGWPARNVVDLGDITASRGTEMYVALWIRLMARLGTPHFSVGLVAEQLGKRRVADVATPTPT